MLRTIQTKRLAHSLLSAENAFQRRTLASISQDLENAYDVVIIGGGVAGVTLACSLGNILTHYVTMAYLIMQLTNSTKKSF